MVERDGAAFGRFQGLGDARRDGLKVVASLPCPGLRPDPGAVLPRHPLPSTSEPTEAEIAQGLVCLFVGVQARPHPVQARADRKEDALRDPRARLGHEVEAAPVPVALQGSHVPLEAHREDDRGLEALISGGGPEPRPGPLGRRRALFAPLVAEPGLEVQQVG